MAIQVENTQMVSLLTGEFQRRYEPQFAWKSACAMHQALGSLRGFWPLSTVDNAGNAYDLSGQFRTLTYNGNPVYTDDGLRWYIDLDGAGDWLSRADEAGLDITGAEAFVASPGLTCGIWIYFDAVAAATEHALAKWDATGNERSYTLYRTAAGLGAFSVSTDGTAVATVDSGTDVMGATTWYFLAGRFTPSAELAVWIDDTQYTNAVAIPASIHSGTATFGVGGRHGAANLVTGNVCLAWLCAAALPDVVVWSVYQQTRALFGK